VLVFVLILIAKENMALWMIFVCLGILFTEIGKDKNRKLLLYLIVFACLYFVVIVAYVMPALSYSKTYEGFKYHALGESPASALFHLLRQPLHALKLLFVKESGDTELNVIKLEFHVFVLLSGFIFLFKKPQYILMLVPVYMQKLLHDDSHMWGIDKQYSIEFAPILTLGVFSVLSGIKNYKRQIFFLVLALIGCVGVTIRSMDRTITYTKKSQIRFYQRSHYTCDLDLTEINEVLTLIPKNKPVSAISNVIPHLALRNSIYQFPLVKDAQFILVTLKGDFYPLNSEAFISEIKKYANCNEWQFLYRSKDILVLKRK
jgi:uncharacterized membrane protein